VEDVVKEVVVKRVDEVVLVVVDVEGAVGVDIDVVVLVDVVVEADPEQFIPYTFTPSLTTLESLVNRNRMLPTLFKGPMLRLPRTPLP
jgi:hypothetical protein